MKTILFQGDSITDCNRPRENDFYLGMGYANIIRGRLGLDYPNEYRFLNRGVGGDRLINIYSRQKYDIVKLKPDYMSILAGINDVINGLDDRENVKYDRFEEIYCMFLQDMKLKLPDTKIFIMEPFFLKGGSFTKNSDEYPDREEYFSLQVAEKSAAAQKTAKEYGAVFIPLQNKLQEAAEKMKLTDITNDGIHLTAVGHEIIAREWIKAFESNK